MSSRHLFAIKLLTLSRFLPYSLHMNSITNISPAQLRRAADIQERIQDLQSQLNQILGATETAPTQTAKGPRKHKMSAAGRRAIAEAARARWAKYNAERGPVKKRKRYFSPQALANIRAGVAKRMAAQGKPSGTKVPHKRKRNMTPAMRAALERAWAARRAMSKK
jgi:hypothetical protein